MMPPPPPATYFRSSIMLLSPIHRIKPTSNSSRPQNEQQRRGAIGPMPSGAIRIGSTMSAFTPGSHVSAFSSARGAVVALDYRMAATPAPPVVRSSPSSVVVADAFCIPCENDRSIATTMKSFGDADGGGGGGGGGSGGGGHPTPQNLRDNPERLAKVKTEMCHFFEEGGSATACPFGSNCEE